MKAIGKFFKFIFWTVFVLVLLAVVAVLTIPWWIGPAVTGVSNRAVPQIVKTDFALNRFEFNQYKGTFGMGKMHLANPEGFPAENCLELDAFDVKFDPVSCFTKKVHIEKITLDGLRVVVDFPSAANFQKIAENAQGECCGECKEDEPKAEEAAEPEEDKDPVKVVIDLVEVKNLKITYGAAPIVVPDFTLTDIGKESGGATWADACEDIYKAICEKSGIVVGAVLDAGKAVIDTGTEAVGAAIDAGTQAVSNVAEAVGNLDASGAVEAATEGANAAVSVVKEGAGATMEAVGAGAGAASEVVGGLVSGAADFVGGAAGSAGDGASAAAGAVSDTAGSAVEAVGNGLNAVGEGAGAAVDAVKGFFK